MGTETIEDIYNLKKKAKQLQPFLSDCTYRFEKYVDDYLQNEQSNSNLESHFVSEGLIAHESAYFVEVIDAHESILEDLKEAVDNLPSCQSHRYIDGKRIHEETLNRELNELIDDYNEDFDEVIRVCGKTAVDDIPGPNVIRSKRNERRSKREAIEERNPADAFQSFFAD